MFPAGKRSKKLAGAFVLALSLVGVALWAQVTATVTGNVKDASGAVVPGATITVKNLESGLTRTAETDANGNYNVPSLPVGQYEVDAGKPGFKQQVRRGITLVVAQQAVVNLTLEVGNVEQQVTVMAEAPLVNTTLSSTSGLVGEKQVKDLPLNGRSFDQLLTLNTGTANYSTNNLYNHTGNAFSVQGKRPETNRFMINGVDYIGADSSGQVVLPNGASGQLLGVDAVREFNVVQNNYGAEYGKRAGGQITIVTTSGTNKLHGDAFEYLRNNKLDARNFFDQGSAPPFKRNQFGGALGGPIKKDKLFLFGNYEGYRQRLGVSNAAIVPDALMRQGQLPDANGVYAVVPNLKTGMLAFANNFWPAPNGPELLSLTGKATGAAFNFSNPAQAVREDFGLIRFDYNATASDSFSANYLIDDGEFDNPNKDSNFIAIAPQRNHLVGLQETHIFSPNLLNVAVVGFTRAGTVSGTIPLVSIPANLLMISGGVPGTISIGGGLGPTAASIVQAGGSNPLKHVRNFYTWSDDIHLTKSAHSISAGVWIQKVQQNLGGSPLANAGQITYPTQTAFLQDLPTTFIGVPNSTPLGYRSTEAAWFFQDEIKLKSNLSLRLGIRDEMTTGWNEITGRAANYVFDQNGVILSDPLIGPSALIQNNSTNLWLPRVGLAWDPTGTGTWAVRAGFGIFNDLQDSLAHRLSSNPPFNARLTRTGTPLLSFIPIPGGTQPPATCTAALLPGCSVFQPGGIDPYLHTPTIQQWSFTVEREITKNLMIQLGYVGSQSYHLSVSIDRNAAPPEVCGNPAGCLSGGGLAANQRQTVPQGTTYMPPVAANPACPGGLQTRPNCYVANTFSWLFAGTASYHSLNVSLVERASRGLTFKVNYTYAKVLDLNSAITSSSGVNEPQMIYNPFNFALNKGVAAFSLRHQFNANYSYELPFGQGQHFGSGAHGAVNQIIGGWQWNGILTAQSGFPFTPQAGSNRTGNGDSFNPDVVNINPAFTGKVILGTPNRWYDPNAFLLPAAGTFGNVSRGSFIGPGFVDFDTSLFKTFKVTERVNLQFRAEVFNLFNHANFGTPSPLVFAGTSFSPSAGVITQSAPSRQLQFALKLNF
jgi:carboxypeptidase family protein